MLDKLSLGFSYLQYLLTSDTKHGIHSPFVYDFTVNVLNDRSSNAGVFHDIELVRHRMLKSDTVISMKDPGAVAKAEYKRSLAAIARNSAKSAKYGQLLYRICRYYKPLYGIELGTSLGISAMYQAAGMEFGKLFTIEGNPAIAEIAAYNFEKQGFDANKLELIAGTFDQVLPRLIHLLPQVDYVFFDGHHTQEATLRNFELCLQKAHNNTLFIFDDIRWSEDMFDCWKKIQNHPDVTVTIDLFFLGLVSFRKEQEKEHFTIRF